MMGEQDVKPLSAEEIKERREIAEASLAAWENERPTSRAQSDRVNAFIERYRVELRLLATIDRLSAQLAALKEYLHFEVDDDGEHHFDWVAGYQSTEKENAKLLAQLATARKGLKMIAIGGVRDLHVAANDTLAAIDEKGAV